MKVSLTRLIGNVQTLKDRIEDFQLQKVIGFKTKGAKVIDGISEESQLKDMRANLQKYNDLVSRYMTLKSILVKANAETMCKIGDEEYSIAQVLMMKNEIGYREEILRQAISQYESTLGAIYRFNDSVKREAELAAKETYGSKQKADANAYEQHVNSYVERNSKELVDPNKLKEFIDKERKAIDFFKEECNYVLSEINSRTEVEIPN